MWTWYCYDDNRPGDLWSRWYHGQSDRTRGQHADVFDALEQMRQWGRPYTKSLSDGLIEIIVRSEVQWRLFGFYWPEGKRNSFTIVLIGNHKDSVYDPPNAIKQARKRLKEIKNGTLGVRRCDRPEEL